MERCPEPELMEDDAQARAYAEADFEEPHREVARLLDACCADWPPEGAALDLGCGPGDISIRFARVHPGWRVDGVDGSAAMLRHGHAAVAAAGLEERVRLHQAYLPRDAPPRPQYDLVFSNSLLHHLADPAVLWQAVANHARAGAPVFIMDLMRPRSVEEVHRLVEEHCAGEPEVLRRDFHNSLYAAYRVEEVAEQLRTAGLAHLEVRAVTNRHLAASGRR